MLDSENYRELRNGKRYNTSIKRTMSESGSIEENVTGNSSENVKGEVSETQALTLETVNGQIRGFIAPLAKGVDSVGSRHGDQLASKPLPQD